MKTKKYETKRNFLMASLLLLASVGCGQSYQGVYTGSNTVQMQGQSVTENVSVTLNPVSGNVVTGLWQSNSGSGSGTIHGTLSGSLVNATMQYTATPTSSNPYACSGTYQGTFSLLSSNQLSVQMSLATATTATATSTTPYYNSYSTGQYCTGAIRQGTLTKPN